MDDCKKYQDLQDEIDRLRDLYSMALSRLQSI